MTADSQPSISQWIIGAKEGRSQAIDALWERYFEKLVRLARQRLAALPRRAADEEDLALSVFASFCHAAEEGRFPDLADRDDLWRLLITITAQKAIDQRRHDGRAKRGGGRVRGESALDQIDTSFLVKRPPGEHDLATEDFVGADLAALDELLQLFVPDLQKSVSAKSARSPG
jgi:DNA-directed RNA polymerase specialized sigma24 family protein